MNMIPGTTPTLTVTLDADISRCSAAELCIRCDKVTILKTSPDDPRSAADKLSARTHSESVRVIGRKIVLYKAFKEEPVIELPD